MSPISGRTTQTSVTNFLYCDDSYLFLKRSAHKKVDAGRLNGIGGKLEPGEDFLTAAIRETEEETGYIVTPQDCRLCGVVKLEGGYAEDWVMCFFAIQVPDKNVPLGMESQEGEFFWLPPDKVLETGMEMVDDLQYVWKYIVAKSEPFFMTAVLNSQEKIEKYSLSIAGTSQH